MDIWKGLIMTKPLVKVYCKDCKYYNDKDICKAGIISTVRIRYHGCAGYIKK